MKRMLHFAKGHGVGNDFLLYTDPEGLLPLTPSQIRFLCDRNKGVGADGVIRAIRSESLAEGAASLAEDADAVWFMDYVNADGSQAQMCGNGVRVFAQYLLEEGLLEGAEHSFVIGTRAGVRDLQQTSGGFNVDLGRWKLNAQEQRVKATNLEVARPGLGIDVGNPHVVVALANESELQEVDLTQAPILMPPSEEGANIEFIVPADPLVVGGVGHVQMRVYERGSGETLACGTGAAAVALAVRNWAGKQAPHQWRVHLPGGILHVRMFATEEGEHVAIGGPASIVYRGQIDFAVLEG